MTEAAQSHQRAPRRSALPRLLDRTARPPLLIAIGFVIVVLGILIVFRPLTSLALLGVYLGLSAIVAGVLDFAGAEGSRWRRALAAGWVVGGIALLIWLGRDIDNLPPTLGVLLMLAGLASLGQAVSRGRFSQRILSATWGGSQIVFGILALTWPDVTVLVVAVVFGVRTIVFGAALLVRGGTALAAVGRSSAETTKRAASRARRVWADVGRIALSMLLVATAAGGWLLSDWLEAGAPVVDSFYNPPSEVPADHGRIIRTDAYTGRAPQGAEVRRILYTTQDALGRPAVGSAMVIAPAEPPEQGLQPVVVWNHGTTGVARGCAPSLSDGTATQWAIPGLDEAIARGWIVVAPDYSGQGAPGIFPYLIGEGEARSALDAALALRELPRLHPMSRIAVWGHSQGGHAALWTSQIAAEYAPRLTVVGTAAIAPAADPVALAEELSQSDAGALLSVLVSWVLVPYADTYPEIDLDDYVTPGARTIVREMTARCLSEPGVMVSALTALGVSEDRPLYSGDLTSGTLGRRLAQNVPTGPWTAPLFIAWGAEDEVIPPSSQRDFVDKLCEAGQPLRATEYPDRIHQDVLQPSSPLVPVLLRWTELRFTPATTDIDSCTR
ncbi:alpha/beta fold hydrolase [Microbacterium sp. RU33B]|uniref:alpha/beta fold hydrolase n=1 Tax=Microbacterium sp. RU33B TaxID=1907390 RepID=UPI000975F2A7|nr:alpha/beta fold hydrolase [Microbacterium sp. RU33B]